MEQQVISLHYQRIEEWLGDRRAVLGKKNKKEYDRLMGLAPKLVQLVRYEIPALQKQKKKLNVALDDAYGAIDEAARVCDSFEKKRSQLFQKYNLESCMKAAGECDLDTAIDARIASSTVHLNEAVRGLAASTYFADLVKEYNHAAKMYSMGMYINDTFLSHFPWLNRVFEERHCALNVGQGEHKHLEPMKNLGDEDAGSLNIDWGDDDTECPIDMGAAVEVVWVDGDIEASAGSCKRDDVDGGCGGDAPLGDDKLPETVPGILSLDVSNFTHRQRIVTELLALQCFASERALMSGDGRLLDECAAAVGVVLNELTTSTEAAFVRMKASHTLRLSLLGEIERLERGIASAVMRRESITARVGQLQEELQQLEPQLEEMLNVARICRDDCLVELSKMFPERTVTIVGDINKYL